MSIVGNSMRALHMMMILGLGLWTLVAAPRVLEDGSVYVVNTGSTGDVNMNATWPPHWIYYYFRIG